jgi:hypothetical protein
MEAVKSSSTAIHWANKNLQNDREIVLEAIRNFGFAIRYVSNEFKHDRIMIKEALIAEKKNNIHWLENAENYFEEINNLKLRYSVIDFLPDEMRNDKEFFLLAVDSNGWIIDRFPDFFKDDLEIKKKAEESKFRYINLRKNKF